MKFIKIHGDYFNPSLIKFIEVTPENTAIVHIEGVDYKKFTGEPIKSFMERLADLLESSRVYE